MSVKPYVKYGVGVRKTIGEMFTGSVQVYATNGGRNGVGVQVGLSWKLGHNPYDVKSAPKKPIVPKSNTQSSKPQTNINMSCNRQLKKIAS